MSQQHENVKMKLKSKNKFRNIPSLEGCRGGFVKTYLLFDLLFTHKNIRLTLCNFDNYNKVFQ